MTNSSNDFTQRNIPNDNNAAFKTTMSAIDNNATDIKPRTGNNAIRHMEVWRPFAQIMPPELCDIIVKTEHNSIFAARVINGEVLRISHGTWTPVAGPHKWIPYPHNTLTSYYIKGKLNRELPLEVVFSYLLQEKHKIEDELREYKNSEIRTVNDELRLAYQQSETKNASLIEANDRIFNDNKQLQQLIATRNDELTKAEHDLEECYATITDLKRQIKDHDSSTINACKQRIKQLSEQLDNITHTNKQLGIENKNLVNIAEQRKQKIADLEHTITELKKNPKPVINLNPDNDTQYIVKYNILSNRYTKLRNLFTNIITQLKNNHIDHDLIKSITISFNNIDNTTLISPTPPTSYTPPTTPQATVSGASAPETPTQERPRIIRIPRSNFLKIPHIGEGTLFLIEPMLKRFNVIIS